MIIVMVRLYVVAINSFIDRFIVRNIVNVFVIHSFIVRNIVNVFVINSCIVILWLLFIVCSWLC